MPDQDFLLPGKQLILSMENGLGTGGRDDLAAKVVGIGPKFEGWRAGGINPGNDCGSAEVVKGRPIRLVAGGLTLGGIEWQPAILGNELSVPVMGPLIGASTNRRYDTIGRSQGEKENQNED
jgi:hypothetical protein